MRNWRTFCAVAETRYPLMSEMAVTAPLQGSLTSSFSLCFECGRPGCGTTSTTSKMYVWWMRREFQHVLFNGAADEIGDSLLLGP